MRPHCYSLALVAFCMSVALVVASSPRDGKKQNKKPLTPIEARKHVGRKITVEMTVKASKNALSHRGEIYLDSEENFRDEKDFAVVITKKGAASLAAAGISDPASHFRGKTIRAKGKVKEVGGIPRIEIDDVKQIRLAKQP
jgi:DNA/RNA endonuclease YhcR with UshA esterase domain